MNAFIRFAFIVLTFLLAVFSFVFLLMMINNDILSEMIIMVTYLRDQRTYQIVAIAFWLTVFVLCLAGMVYGIMSGRLRRSRIRRAHAGEVARTAPRRPGSHQNSRGETRSPPGLPVRRRCLHGPRLLHGRAGTQGWRTMNNLDQTRAAHALERADALNRKAVNKLPALIVENGLLATVAFVKASEQRSGMLEALHAVGDYLQRRDLLEPRCDGVGSADSILSLARADSDRLQRATTEALAYLTFLKRFARRGD